MTRTLRAFSAVAGAALLLDACSSVLGIEERRLRVEDPDAGPPGAGGQAGSGGAASGGVTNPGGAGGDPVGTGLVGGGPTGGGPGAGGGCADGARCQTGRNTPGVCLGGTCANCTGPVDVVDANCQRAYGAAQACCSSSGSCAPCPSLECERAAEGDDCTSAPTASRKGVCVDGSCRECNDPPAVFSNTCMLNVGGTRLCCGAANECVECPATSDCGARPAGSPCNTSPDGPGFCAQGRCQTCTVHGGPDPLCASAFGAVQGCCNQDGTGCETCPSAATCPSVPCVGGQVCIAGACSPCQNRGGTDPGCAVYGAASECCSLGGVCGSCPVIPTSELVDTAPAGVTFRDIAAAGERVAWTAVATGGTGGSLRGLPGGALPATPLDLAAEPTGPLGGDAVDTFYWAHAGGIRYFRDVAPSAGEVAPGSGVQGIAASPTHLFWTTSSGQVQKTERAPGGGVLDLVLPGGAGTRIAEGGGSVYWAVGDQLHRTSTDGGVDAIVAQSPGGTVVDFALGPSTVYWLVSSGTVRSQSLAVLTDPSNSLVDTLFFSQFGGITRAPTGDLFFTADSAVHRLKPKPDGVTFELTKVTDAQAPVGRVAYTSTHLYFIQANGQQIRRIARP